MEEARVQKGKGRRNLLCTGYSACLETAVHQGWRNFNCGVCSPRYETHDDEQQDELLRSLEMKEKKVCAACGHEKSIEEFNRTTAYSDGRCNRCKQCSKDHRPSLRKPVKERTLDGARAAGSREPPAGTVFSTSELDADQAQEVPEMEENPPEPEQIPVEDSAGIREELPPTKYPPIVMPESQWNEIRMLALAKAIHEYIEAGIINLQVHDWSNELTRLLWEREIQGTSEKE